MACNHSEAVGKEENPLAMVVFQEKGDGTIAYSKVCSLPDGISIRDSHYWKGRDR